MNDDILKFVENDRFADYIGAKIIKVDIGYAVTKLDIEEKHLNGVNIVQGGVIYTLADYAFAVASNSKGFKTVGINSTISYFKSPKGKSITAEAKEISSTRKICNYSIDVFDENNDLIANLNATGFVLYN